MCSVDLNSQLGGIHVQAHFVSLCPLSSLWRLRSGDDRRNSRLSDFPKHRVGYASTECSYVASKSGEDVNGKYSVRTESTKVTAGYADDCRPK